MSDKKFQPVDVQIKNDKSAVEIHWADDHVSQIPISRLRGYCPCAECQGHGGDIQWIDNKANAITAAEAVGRYAILFTFSDGHSTGIYSWEPLRKLDPSEDWGDPANFMRKA